MKSKTASQKEKIKKEKDSHYAGMNAKEKKLAKETELIESMKFVMVNTLEGKSSLHHLCYTVGVKERKKYFAVVGLKEKEDKEGNKTWVDDEKILSYGLKFKDGFEIKHVDHKHFNLFKDIDIRLVKCRA